MSGSTPARRFTISRPNLRRVGSSVEAYEKAAHVTGLHARPRQFVQEAPTKTIIRGHPDAVVEHAVKCCVRGRGSASNCIYAHSDASGTHDVHFERIEWIDRGAAATPRSGGPSTTPQRRRRTTTARCCEPRFDDSPSSALVGACMGKMTP